MIGLILGNLLGGIAVIETVFTIPGLRAADGRQYLCA